MDLIKQSREEGFMSKDNLIIVNQSYYYLWMCELQKWLIENHNLYIGIAITEDRWLVQVFDIESQEQEENMEFDQCYCNNNTYGEALERGLFKALELIKNK